jgi:Peptidase M50B-like
MSFFKEKLSVRFFLFIALTIILVQIPIIGDYFRIINTVIHESGHAFISLFVGHVDTIALLMNADGITRGTQSIWIINVITSGAGYIFSSFMAFFSFWLIRKEKYTVLIDILLVFIIINLLLWVRNPYGLFWLVSFGLLFLSLLIKGSKTVIINLCQLIASVLLVESISSAYDIFLISMMNPQAAGDATNLSQLTVLLPAHVWGGFFFIQALLFSFLGFKKGFFLIGAVKVSAEFQIDSTHKY